MKYLAPILLAAAWLWPTTALCNISQETASVDKDSVPTFTSGYTEHAVYPENMGKKSKIYNKLWGRHYRDLYCIPIHVPVAPLDSIRGGLIVLEQAKKFHGLLLTDPANNMYLLRPIGGSTTFLESDFFQSMYNWNLTFSSLCIIRMISGELIQMLLLQMPIPLSIHIPSM
ncbi:MAG: hypothetical protein LIO97_05925 [Tannerellaceae bacterium]|nr:hypothetical protein [Tannerellaceae bacterium]